MSLAVSARGLSYTYGRQPALLSMDLDVPTGVTALLGPNGAGKSTLLHLICGLARVRSGELTVLGVNARKKHSRRALAGVVGFLPQTFGYLPGYTVAEFVTYAAWLKKVAADDMGGLVSSAVAAVGLDDRRDSKLRSLSGGMLRRVGIAAAIVHRPALLVLDEPSVGLDPEQRADLRDLLVAVGGTTSVFLSTHQIEDVRLVADTVIVVSDGRTRFTGTPGQLERAHLKPDDDTEQASMEDGYLSVLERRLARRTSAVRNAS